MRYVIVAQLRPEPHCPDVFGIWNSYEAAEQQMTAWKGRIERTLGEGYDGIHMSVEPIYQRSAEMFAEDFAIRTGWDLAP